MPERVGYAQWHGSLKDGEGTVRLGSGAFEGNYSFASRMENGKGTNPEELIAAAHAGCFSMALANGLSKGGHTPKTIKTTATVSFEQAAGGYEISKIELQTEGDVPGIDESAFKNAAEDAKKNCPVSKALGGVKITLQATLKSGVAAG